MVTTYTNRLHLFVQPSDTEQANKLMAEVTGRTEDKGTFYKSTMLNGATWYVADILLTTAMYDAFRREFHRVETLIPFVTTNSLTPTFVWSPQATVYPAQVGKPWYFNDSVLHMNSNKQSFPSCLYVSSSGSHLNDGCLNSTVDIRTAIQMIGTGGIVYVRGGDECTMDKNALSKRDDITIQNYENEYAKIRIVSCDHAKESKVVKIDLGGMRTQMRKSGKGQLEIYSTPTYRGPEGYTGTSGDHYPAMGQIYYSANEAPSKGCFNGIIVHDLLQIAAQQTPNGGLVAKGVMILNMGYKFKDSSDEDGENGDCFYLQNAVGDPIKQVFNCLFGPSYGEIVQVSAGTTGQGEIEFCYCSVHGGGRRFFLRGMQEWERIRCQDSVLIKANIPLGQAGQPNGTGQFLDNYTIDSRLAANEWKTLEVTGNTVVAQAADVIRFENYIASYNAAPGSTSVNWNCNTYYNEPYYNDDKPVIKPFNIVDKCGRHNRYTFDEWQAKGLDVSSMHMNSLPTTTVIFVRPISDVDGVKGTIDVLAWGLPTPSSVSVNVAALSLTDGVQYCLRSRDNPTNAAPTGPNNIVNFTYDGSGSITIPLTGRTVAAPSGGECLGTIDQRFGAWRVEEV
jgi:hypothetical protein